MSETKFDVAGVVALHSVGAFSGTHTACRHDRKWRTNEDYRDHLAAAISAHIAETLGSSEARSTLAISLGRTLAPRGARPASDRMVYPQPHLADAALAAVGDLLGVEVGR